jgi:hypothetical protein
MTYGDWASLAVSVLTIAGAFIAAVKWLVKHYLNELKPNSGTSLSDRVTRIESKVEAMYEIILKGGR